MKKIYLLMAAALMMVGCAKENNEPVTTGKKTVTINFSPYTMTPMKTQQGISTYCNRLDVWIVDNATPTDTVEFHQSGNSIGTVSLDVNTTHTYTIIAVAHRCPSEADIVGNLIVFPNEKVSHSFFYKNTFNPEFETDLTCVMNRIVGQFRLEVQDAIPNDVTQFQFIVDSSYTRWNTETNLPAHKMETTLTYTSFTRADDGTASFTVSVMALSDEVSNVDITMKALRSDNSVYQQHTLEDVPMKNGYITTYAGTFFRDFNLGLTFVADDWSNLGSYTF